MVNSTSSFSLQTPIAFYEARQVLLAISGAALVASIMYSLLFAVDAATNISEAMNASPVDRPLVLVTSALCATSALVLIAAVRFARGAAILGAALAFATSFAAMIVAPNTVRIASRATSDLPYVAMGVVVISYFIAEIARAGWSMAIADSTARSIGNSYTTRISFLLEAAGIHPICAHLPSYWKRVLSAGLFLLGRVVLGYGIFMLLSALSVGPFIFVHLSYGVLAYFFVIAILLALLTGFLFVLRRGGRSIARLSMEELILGDHRDPILFLRSFSDDQVRLRPPPRSPLRRLAQLGSPSPFLDHILLEEITPKAPILAIGAPGTLPPFGIPRTYVENEDWKAVVARMCLAAQYILVAIDQTEGLQWELNHIASSNLIHKVMFLCPPRFSGPVVAEKIALALPIAASDRGLFGNIVRETFDRLQSQCIIGWFIQDGLELRVITAKQPSDIAYLLAVRYFLENSRQGQTSPGYHA